MSTEGQVRELISLTLGVDEDRIIPQAEIVNDLGADSLDVNELVMAFEDAFDLEIPDEDSVKFKYVKNITEYIDLRV